MSTTQIQYKCSTLNEMSILPKLEEKVLYSMLVYEHLWIYRVRVSLCLENLASD